MANSHKRNNGIESLMVDGILSLDQGMIADCITQFFMKLYSKEQVDRPFPEVLVFPRISGDNADWLDRLPPPPYNKKIILCTQTNNEIVRNIYNNILLIPNFSIEWLILIEEIMVLRALWLMESCLQIKV